MQRMADEHKIWQPLFMSLTILLAPAFPIIYTMYIFSSFQCLGVCMLHFSHNSQRVPKEKCGQTRHRISTKPESCRLCNSSNTTQASKGFLTGKLTQYTQKASSSLTLFASSGNVCVFLILETLSCLSGWLQANVSGLCFSSSVNWPCCLDKRLVSSGRRSVLWFCGWGVNRNTGRVRHACYVNWLRYILDVILNISRSFWLFWVFVF